MSYVQEYPLKPALSKITHHDQLPPNAIEIGRLVDTTEAKDIYGHLEKPPSQYR